MWQPIETAPTDGTAVLLWPYGYSDIWQGHADCEVVLGYFDNEGREEWFNPEAREWFEPTHWMPLPAPPELNNE
jgi:hypothetical protein